MKTPDRFHRVAVVAFAAIFAAAIGVMPVEGAPAGVTVKNAAGVPFWGFILELSLLVIWLGVPVLCVWGIVRARTIKSWFVRWTVRILCAIPIWLAFVVYRGCKSFHDTFN